MPETPYFFTGFTATGCFAGTFLGFPCGILNRNPSPPSNPPASTDSVALCDWKDTVARE